jgi:hypothetical protein
MPTQENSCSTICKFDDWQLVAEEKKEEKDRGTLENNLFVRIRGSHVLTAYQVVKDLS